MKILKFGGSSLANSDCISRVLEIISHQKGKFVVIVSALGKTTDALLKITDTAVNSSDWQSQHKELLNYHFKIIRELFPVQTASKQLAYVQTRMNELSELLQAVEVLKHISERIKDQILSYGERISAYVVAEAGRTRKLKTCFVDAREYIVTDENHGDAQVNMKETQKSLSHLGLNNIPIVTGFIAATPKGVTTTLGRGGSDYTASIVAACLNAEEIQIWTDVPGFNTADPRIVNCSKSIPEISYKEAMELSHFGAEVIYSPTFLPAQKRNIPIRIKNTFAPKEKGTLIHSTPKTSSGLVSGLSLISNTVLMRLSGLGLQGSKGTAGKLFNTLGENKINVILITQGSSEQSICWAVHPNNVEKAKECVEKAFELEIHKGQVNPVATESGYSVLSVVGEKMINTPGVSGKIFSALGKRNINIHVIAQGSSERAICVVVNKADSEIALKVVHKAFFTEKIKVYLVGHTGTIGEELKRQMKLIPRLELSGVCNTSQMVVNGKGSKTNIKKFLAHIESGDVMIDCTPGVKIIPHYKRILKSGAMVVTPNKKALSGPQKQFDFLKKYFSLFGFEANVGAGLPILNTLQKLQATGDLIHRVECVASGTLSYLLNAYTGEMPFSKLVYQAQVSGYTEPDPRDDLSGIDVARKILILARLCGYRGEIDDIAITPLMNKEAEVSAMENFYVLLSDYDEKFHKQWEKANQNNKKLCYIASYSLTEGLSVGLRAITNSHPFYSLVGAENAFSFWTNTYLDIPLTVRGFGAGASVTAQGVLSDILSLTPSYNEI